MPQLTDRSKLPNIIDPVIKDTMDPKHLYQVLIPNKLLTFSNSDTFIFQQFMLMFHACAGCSSSCSMCAARTELQTADNRRSPLPCSSGTRGSRGNAQSYRATFSTPNALSFLRNDPTSFVEAGERELYGPE